MLGEGIGRNAPIKGDRHRQVQPVGCKSSSWKVGHFLI